MKYTQENAITKDGWSRWIRPVRKGYKAAEQIIQEAVTADLSAARQEIAELRDRLQNAGLGG
jgi:hypothetical protein